MSARGFGSVLWAGAVAGAALGFYLVSLNVASERAQLEEVETRIALAQRDIRLLPTVIGPRGRLAPLERWNVTFIRRAAGRTTEEAGDRGAGGAGRGAGRAGNPAAAELVGRRS